MVDSVLGSIDLIVLNGYHKVIGEGEFRNTRIFNGEELLRGVQSIVMTISKENHTYVSIKFIFMPNIIEDGKEDGQTENN